LYCSSDADPENMSLDQLLTRCPPAEMPWKAPSLLMHSHSRGKTFHANLSPYTVSHLSHTDLAHCRLSMILCCGYLRPVYKSILPKGIRHTPKPVTRSSGIQAIH
ncbi:hypothetical protein EV714DRAFT_249455, partial [Schizophyllum commune]